MKDPTRNIILSQQRQTIASDLRSLADKFSKGDTVQQLCTKYAEQEAREIAFIDDLFKDAPRAPTTVTSSSAETDVIHHDSEAP